MRISVIGRISQWGLGAACIISLAACGAADQRAGAPSGTAAPAASADATSAPSQAETKPTIALKETVMPDQPSPQLRDPARPTFQVAATLVLESAPPAGQSPATPTAPSRPALRATPLAPAETTAPAPSPPNSAIVVPPLGPALTGMVDTSRADLARRLSIPVEQIELVEMRTVVWPDGGLGCPRPGMVYLQVQVDGLLIRLRGGDQIYNYHTDGIKPPFLCEQKLKGTPATPAPSVDVNK